MHISRWGEMHSREDMCSGAGKPSSACHTLGSAIVKQNKQKNMDSQETRKGPMRGAMGL